MPTITGQAIINKARILLNDDIVTDAELLGWLNDGQRFIAANKNNAYIKNQNFQCVSGTKQTVPADCLQFIKPTRNMGVSGTVPGASIQMIAEDVINGLRPNWHSETTSAITKHYIFDPRDQKTFYVYPPQPTVSPGYIEIVYGAIPADIAIGTVILIDDIYASVLMDYIVYRVSIKDDEYAVNGRAELSLKTAIAALSGKAQAESAT